MYAQGFCDSEGWALSMSKQDEAKLVDIFEFGEDWLGDLNLEGLSAEALSWDEDDGEDDLVAGLGRVPEVVIQAVDVREEEALVLAQGEAEEETDARTHVLHYLSLVLLRLFDDLELIFLQGRSEECVDLAKQICRLGNILTFCGFHDQLPVLAYVYNMLPAAHEETQIGESANLLYFPEREARFSRKQAEFLHCFYYILGQLKTDFEDAQLDRYDESLARIYQKLEISASMPSAEAPLPVTDSVNPRELTSRTINKLARTLDGLMTEAIHFIESTALYGYSTGYREANLCFQDAAQVAHEFKLNNLVEDFKTLSAELGQLSAKDKPSESLYPLFENVFVKLKKHFPHLLLEKKLRHLYGIIAKFSPNNDFSAIESSFELRWQRFMQEITPILKQVLSAYNAEDNAIIRLCSASIKHDIKWLTTIFSTFNKYWRSFPESCLEAFLILAQDILSLPIEHISEERLKSLTNDKLRILFERKSSQRNISPFTLVQAAKEFWQRLSESAGEPSEIPRDILQNLIIDARSLKCHAILRSCESLGDVLDSADKEFQELGTVMDCTIDAVFFCSELLRNCTTVVEQLCERNDVENLIGAPRYFYEVLLRMHRVEGMPSDPAMVFVSKLVAEISKEIQLVWSNTATPTSTDYYCGLLAKILHIANIFELGALREKTLELLNDIPNQSFINTQNASLQRQTYSLMRLAQHNIPKPPPIAHKDEVCLFFARCASSTSFFAVSNADSAGLAQSLRRLESELFPIAKASRNVSCIALAYELRALHRTSSLTHEDINNFLFWLLRVAHNISPTWTQSNAQWHEDLNIPLSIPITSYLRHYRAIEALSAELADKIEMFPAVWDAIHNLRVSAQQFSSPQYMLASLALNVKNRCAYLKKSIDFTTHFHTASLPNDDVHKRKLAKYHAFFHVMEKIVELLIQSAFHKNDITSYIQVHLSLQRKALSASISHNGEYFSYDEIINVLSRFKLIPATDDDLFDLLSQVQRIQRIYPPAVSIAYFLPIIRQFSGKVDIHTIDSITYINLQFPLS
jgi:hypothetical protein